MIAHPPRPAPSPLDLHRWLRRIPAYLARPVEILRHYRKADLLPDAISGLTVAVVILPQAIAYALIAELPPQMGLYAAIVASIVGALWGSSRHIHTGPTNAISLLVLSSLAAAALPGSAEFVVAAGLMTLMVGVAQIVMGLARMGVLVNFVSHSVIVGFTAGAGVLIVANQMRHLLRLDIPGSAEFVETAVEITRHFGELHTPSLALGAGTIIVILALRRFRPGWPGPLISMALASAAVAAAQLNDRGVKVLGELPRSLPPLAHLPLFDLELIRLVSTGALAVAAMGLVETMSMARAIAAQSGQRLDSNQEFVGQGLANVASGFFSGYVTSGSFTRSAVLYTSGGRTALASVFSGVWTLGAVLLFAPLTAYLPRAALAGVLMVTAYYMVDRRAMMHIVRASRGDSLIMFATILATIFLPLEFAVLAGMIVSFARYIVQTSTPGVESVLPDDNYNHLVHRPGQPACPQMAAIVIRGSLYFGATQHVEDVIRSNLEKHPGQRFLLLKMNLVDLCDVTGIHMLESVVRLYRQHGGEVYVMRVTDAVRDKMRSSGFDRLLGADHFLPEETAIGYLFHRVLDPAVCIYECEVRAWKECQNLPKHPYPAGLPLSQWPLPKGGVREVEARALWDQLRQAPSPPLVIDVREPAEFKRGHIPQAQLLPLRQMLGANAELPLDHEIVLVCRTGRRSARAAAALQAIGHVNLRILGGGMIAWGTAGLLEAIDL